MWQMRLTFFAATFSSVSRKLHHLHTTKNKMDVVVHTFRRGAGGLFAVQIRAEMALVRGSAKNLTENATPARKARDMRLNLSAGAMQSTAITGSRYSINATQNKQLKQLQIQHNACPYTIFLDGYFRALYRLRRCVDHKCVCVRSIGREG